LKPIASSDAVTTVVGEPIIVRKLGENEYRDKDAIEVPETATDADNPSSETTDVKKKPTKLDESDANSVLEADYPPSIDEADVDSSKLEIDSNDDADIKSRPLESGEAAGMDDVTLNGSE
jgi:hypothetical protein